VQVTAPPGGQGVAEPGDVSVGGDLGGADELVGFSLRAGPGGGGGPAGGLPVHLREPGAGQVPAADSCGDHGGQAPVQPGALALGGRGADCFLHVGDLDVLAGEAGDDRGDEPVAQPALGVGVLGGPRLPGRVPVRGQVVGDEVGAGPFHVRGVRGQPLGDLLQPGRQLLLGHRLALAPLAVLMPDRTPPAPLRPGRVHSDPALHLNHHTVFAAGARARVPAQQGAWL
jgi:hypothetical protein